MARSLGLPLARFYGCDPELSEWPTDIPTELRGIMLDFGTGLEACAASSARLYAIAKGRDGKFGFVVAHDTRIKEGVPSPFVYGNPGGGVKEDFAPTPGECQVPETIMEGIIRETHEEVGIRFSPDQLFLFGVRSITSQATREIVETASGATQVDALFIAFSSIPPDEYFGGRVGETGERVVLSARELFAPISDVQKRMGKRRTIPDAQAVGLATAILSLSDLPISEQDGAQIGDETLEKLALFVRESTPIAEEYLRVSRLKQYVRRVVPVAPWKF